MLILGVCFFLYFLKLLDTNGLLTTQVADVLHFDNKTQHPIRRTILIQ